MDLLVQEGRDSVACTAAFGGDSDSLTLSTETCVIDLDDDILGPALFYLLAAVESGKGVIRGPLYGVLCQILWRGRGASRLKT